MNTFIQSTDTALIKRFQEGNNDALETLIRRHEEKIFSSIFFLVKDEYLAEDLFQDVFIKIIDKLRKKQYNEEGKFLPWIVRIAHNMAIDYFRKEKRYPKIVLDDGSPLWNSFQFAEESSEDKQLKEDVIVNIRDLIKKLPDEQREVLIMRHYEDLSFQEIADLTHVSINTALGRMRYALINLRKMLEKQNLAYDKKLYPE